MRLCLPSSLSDKTEIPELLVPCFHLPGEKLPSLSSATCSRVYLALWTLPGGSLDRTGVHTGSCCLRQHQCGHKETGGCW